MTVALATGAPSTCTETWAGIDWTAVYKHVHRLQMRIAKVSRARTLAQGRRLESHSDSLVLRQTLGGKTSRYQ